jgi:hypothetical protein
MDLYDFTSRNRTANAKHLLDGAAYVMKAIINCTVSAPGDELLRDVASSTEYTAQGGTAEKKPAFPRLLAAFDAAVETVATKAEKKNRDKRGFYYYTITNFLHRMSQDQRRELKLALHADAEAIIAAARRDATDGTPKLFDGEPLPSASTAEVRLKLGALYQEAQQQLHALQRRITALNECEDILKELDEGLAAAEAFERDTLPLLLLGTSDTTTVQPSQDGSSHGVAKRGRKE